MTSLRQRLLALPRRRKRLLQLATDILLIWLALWLALLASVPAAAALPWGAHAWLYLVTPLLALPLFVRLGLYRAVMRYFGHHALQAIAIAVALSALLQAAAILLFAPAGPRPPLVLSLNYGWLSLLLIGGLRLLLRQYFLGDWYVGAAPRRASLPGQELPRVAIYGAGAAGNQLVAALRLGRSMRPVAFIDDDSGLARRTIAGLPVYKPRHIQRMIAETGAEEILLAIPSASRRRRREILAALENHPLHVRSVPGFMDLASGRVRVEDIQEVDIADLLGRDVVAPRLDLFARCIRDQVVMVTGAGGSIGSELCRQILSQRPATLILFEHSEYNLYCIHQELQGQCGATRLLPILGTIGNPDQLHDVMSAWQVATLYHAAAYKHVPMVEHNIAAGVRNNLLGTLNVAQAALRAGVRHCVLVSTDKAVRPTNVMGCTKRLAELVLQALAREPRPALHGLGHLPPVENRTCFSMVRFGNVLGSSGSVIPLFREQIRRGGPVTVTHPDITRYFMTIPEAAQLVIQAGAMARGGEVFVLDMGEPVRIVELAERMIRLSGLRPHADIAIAFSGLRPGEKLYEELLIGANAEATEHPMIRRADERHLPWPRLCRLLEAFGQALATDDCPQLCRLLAEAVEEYRPQGGPVDWIHLQRQAQGQPRHAAGEQS